MHKCLKCGNEFEGKFCPECGAKFIEPDACPKCGAKHPPEAKFCSECGARLDGKIVCYKCGALSDAGTAFCGECGTRLGGAVKPQKDRAAVRDKVKFAIYLSGIICILLSALMGLAFAFACGVSGVDAETGKVVDTNLVYYYFKDVYEALDLTRQTLLSEYNWASIGGAREFALYFPAVLGTVTVAVGLLGVVALSVLTGFKVYKKFVKKQQANIVAPAVATYLTFATIATMLLLLSAANVNGSKVVFSTPTLAGLITGGVLLGLGALLIAGSQYEAFRGFDATVGSALSVAVCAFTVVVVALAALPAVGLETRYFNGYMFVTTKMSVGLLPGMQSMLLVTAEDEKIFKIIAYCTVGGVAAIALAVISAVTLFRKIPTVCEGRNKSNIILCAVAVGLAAVYLAFTVLFVNEMMAESTAEIKKNFGVPISTLVMTVLALAAEVAGRFIRKKPSLGEAAEAPAGAE